MTRTYRKKIWWKHWQRGSCPVVLRLSDGIYLRALRGLSADRLAEGYDRHKASSAVRDPIVGLKIYPSGKIRKWVKQAFHSRDRLKIRRALKRGEFDE